MMAPHTSSLAFSFLACTCALLGMAPHTPSLAFSFLACACALLGGVLRTRQILLFLFWRVPVPCWVGSAHAKSCFFFSGVCLCLVGGCSAHAKSCFFFSGVCMCPVGNGSAHAKSCFFFSGVCLCPVGNGSAHAKSCFFFSGVYLCPVGVAPHTPNLAFSFLACACSLRLRQQANMVTPPRFARRQVGGWH